MQFQMITGYAIRIVVCLYQNEGTLLSAKQMADEIGISIQYFMKVVERLKQAGIVQSIRGCNGGYQLNKEVKDITFYDIVYAMQGEIKISKCFPGDGYAERNSTAAEGICKVFEEIEAELIRCLKSKHISDIEII